MQDPVPEARVVAADQVLVANVAETCALLNGRTEEFFGLDEVGTRMWGALQQHPTIRDAALAVAEHYDASAERVEADLLAFVAELREQGLVEIHPA